MQNNVSFIVKTRLNGRQKIFTIGKYGVWTIQNARKDQDGLIINAGGYTHTSVAIHDALKILNIPIPVIQKCGGGSVRCMIAELI